ncbi:hypothetical protein B0T14DRAFT_512530 [Immersiella caudata]|uniref:Archaemetzincin-2 n=1 Tax=Immersiella caudata TaxID=314043 RepID=A0AA39X4Y2_9PEZI|nr:hypothetical protein B0T14DRAFT_512530 [Immersiella caudata]
MPTKRKTPCAACAHTEGLQIDVSDHAAEAGFTRPNPTARKAAATPSGRIGQFRGTTVDADQEAIFAHTFPGPLILPDDALFIDPKDPPQSLRSWTVEKMRNPFTEQRKTLYVAPVPTIPTNLSCMRSWARPVQASPKALTTAQSLRPPQIEDVTSYLEAFYHPLPVKTYPGTVAFTEWEDESKSSKKKKTASSTPPDTVGLQVGEEGITGIRTRYCPDGTFARQLNLSDILDAALEALLEDAYSLVMLIDQDLYEDEEDDFCCGRAFGSSRIAVVSSARYHPDLDVGVVDREHMWPASHCVKYVREMVGEGRVPKQAVKYGDTPLAAAVKAAVEAPAPEGDLYGLWFSRVARTVAHELGHCLCLGHCSYYACVMQGTAGMGEDVRQPPYLCPVCLAKVTKGLTVLTPGLEEKEFQVQRYRALQKFCEGWMGVGMFAGYHAWLEKRIQSMDNAT